MDPAGAGVCAGAGFFAGGMSLASGGSCGAVSGRSVLDPRQPLLKLQNPDKEAIALLGGGLCPAERHQGENDDKQDDQQGDGDEDQFHGIRVITADRG